ncbi:hypothetical protein ACFL1E_01995 [Candidatus Omnitrophota bacterium]
MDVPKQENVSSIESIASSIETDHQVYRWFSFLIAQPGVKQRLEKVKGYIELCCRLSKAIRVQRMLCAVLLCVGLFALYTEEYIYFGWVPILMYPCIRLHYLRKKTVVEISTQLITCDYKKQELSQKTLYQLGEIYSRKYDTLSLVDGIQALDNISRITIVAAFIIACFVFSSSILKVYLFAISAYFIVYIVINMPFMYKRFK